MRSAEGSLAGGRFRRPLELRRTTRDGHRLIPATVLCAAALLGGAVGPAIVQSPARAAVQPSLRAKAAALASALQAAYVKLDGLDESYDEAKAKVAKLERAVTAESAAIGRSERRLSNDTGRLRAVAIATYVSAGTSSGLAVLLAGDQQASEQQAYLSAASGNLSASISAVRLDRRRLAQRKARLVDAERSAATSERQIAGDRAEAATTTAALESTLATVRGKLAQAVGAAEGTAAGLSAGKATMKRTSHKIVAKRHPARRPRGPTGGGAGASAVRAAESQLGVPYMWGGAYPGQGFDCSGLTMWAWGQAGVSLAHGATDQYYETRHVSMSDLQPGDLIFYGYSGYLYHVVMYVGSGPYGRDTVIQAEHTGTDVMFTPIPPGPYGASQP